MTVLTYLLLVVILGGGLMLGLLVQALLKMDDQF